MSDKIKTSSILQEYHEDSMKEHKFFLSLLVTRQRDEAKLRKQYANTPKYKKKTRKKLKDKIPPRVTGRPRVCFDMETAKRIVRSEGIASLTQYRRWYEINQPVKMPKNPQRAYAKEWTGWGDFLGVYNTYSRRAGDTTNGRGKYRTLGEARAFATTLGLKTKNDWLSYVRSGVCPADIPFRPDIVYTKGIGGEYWLSWKNFLGSEIVNSLDIIETSVPIMYIGRSPYTVMRNVYVINVIPGGRPALVEHLTKTQFTLIAAYYIDNKFNHKNIINGLSKYSNGAIDEYIIDNIYEIMDILSNNLNKVV